MLSPSGPELELLDYVTFERNVVTNYEWALIVDNMWNGMIRNNLFVTPNGGQAIALNWQALGGGCSCRPLQNVSVIGNTMISGSKNVSGPVYSILRMLPYPSSAPQTYGSNDTNVAIADNLFATYPGAVTPTGIELTGAIAGLTSDRNLFHLPNVSGGHYFKLGATSYTLADWRTATGYDANSVDAAPGFAGGNISEIDQMVPGMPADQNACLAAAKQYVATFQLAPGSPAIDSGVTLGLLHDDFLRAARPADGNGDGISQTDIGAFEYQPAK
jgi:hypothetical protein